MPLDFWSSGDILTGMVLMKTLSCAVAAALVLTPAAMSQSLSANAERADQARELLAELAQPNLATSEAVERRLERLWSQSGSDTADLMLQRGRDALDAEDYQTALEHLTALTDHAPEFAEGWYMRSTAFYQLEEFGLAIDDILRTLALNPDHFGAFLGLSVMHEEMGRTESALLAIEEAYRLNPNNEAIAETRERLRRATGNTTL